MSQQINNTQQVLNMTEIRKTYKEYFEGNFR